MADLQGILASGDPPVGIGGKAREAAIMGQVDRAAGGTGGAGQAKAAINAAANPSKVHPAAYKPSQAERAARSYGTPVSTPILHGGG